MKNPYKKSLVLIFSLSLLASSCGIGSNKSNKIDENSNTTSSVIEEPKVSARGKVLCFERAQKEENAFLAEVAYENCLETIDESLAKFDEEQADLYFLEKNNKKDIDKKKNKPKKANKKKKKKKKNSKIVKTKKENSCKEGTIAGGAIGAGIGLATSKGKDRFWAVPAAGTIGALVGCQIDGG